MSQEKGGGRRAQHTLNGFLSPAIAFSLKPHSFPLPVPPPLCLHKRRESLTEVIGAFGEIFGSRQIGSLNLISCQPRQIGPHIFMVLAGPKGNWQIGPLSFSGILLPTFEEGDRKLVPALNWARFARAQCQGPICLEPP